MAKSQLMEYQSHALVVFGALIAKYFHHKEMVELTDGSRWMFGSTSKNFLCVHTPDGSPVTEGYPFYNRSKPHPGMKESVYIVSARITAQPKSILDPMPSVYGQFNDGTEQLLFTYYPDELTFTKEEFIGLTAQQAQNLRHKKDVAYLQS